MSVVHVARETKTTTECFTGTVRLCKSGTIGSKL